MPKKEDKQIVKFEKGESIYSSMERFEYAQRVANSLASCTFIPDAFQGHVSNCLIALEIATRYEKLKNPPHVMAIMQQLYVVHGKPAFESKFLIAVVNTCGYFSPLRWKFEGSRDSTYWGARAYATDLRTNEECMGPLVDMEMAKGEGWLDKKGSKWQTMPEQMLRYRSASFWIKVFAPELLLGMSAVDELMDSQEVIAESEVVTEDGNSLDSLADKLSAGHNETED